MNYPSIFFGFFGWWYTGGVKNNIRFLGALFGYITNLFSITEIFRTFFTPWRRIVGPHGKGLLGFRDWLVDNLVSRTVGVFLRSMVFLVYLAFLFLYFVFAALSVTAWILMPFLILAAVVNLSGVLI